MSDGESGCASAEASVGDEGTFLAHVHGLDVTGGIEHLLHAGTSLGTLMGDDHHVALLHLASEDALAGVFLRVEHHGRTREAPDAFVHTGGLHHAAVLGDVAEEHCQAAILGVGVLDGTDATVLAVGIQSLVHGALCTHLVAEHTGRCAAVYSLCLGVNVVLEDGVFLNVLGQCGTVHPLHGGVYQPALGKFAKEVEHTAGTSALLHAVLLAVGGQFAEERSLARKFVHILHGEVHLGLLRYGQQMQHGVGAGSHGYVQGHGIEESLACGYAAGQNALVTILVVGKGVLYYLPGGVLEELHTVGVCGQDGSVAGQGQAYALGEVVHGVGGEHAAAASTSGTGAVFHLGQFLVANGLVGSLHHGTYKVEVLALVLAGLHGAAAHEHCGDIQAHGCHEHARGYLVAVGNAYHGVCLVGVAHVFHAVGNDVAAGQRIKHAVVAHGNTVVYGDGVEFGGIASHALYLGLHYLAYLMQMGVTGDKLGE